MVGLNDVKGLFQHDFMIMWLYKLETAMWSPYNSLFLKLNILSSLTSPITCSRLYCQLSSRLSSLPVSFFYLTALLWDAVSQLQFQKYSICRKNHFPRPSSYSFANMTFDDKGLRSCMGIYWSTSCCSARLVFIKSVPSLFCYIV